MQMHPLSYRDAYEYINRCKAFRLLALGTELENSHLYLGAAVAWW